MTRRRGETPDEETALQLFATDDGRQQDVRPDRVSHFPMTPCIGKPRSVSRQSWEVTGTGSGEFWITIAMVYIDATPYGR